MKIDAIVRWTAVALLLSPPRLDDGVRFGAARLKKDARFSATSTNDATMKTTVKGSGVEQELESANTVQYAYAITVTACDEKGEQVATIELTRAHFRTSTPINDDERDSPAAGKTWIATRHADAWTFSCDGAAPPDDDAKATLGDLATRALGAAPLATALAGKTFKLGDKIAIAPADAQKLLATFAESSPVKSFELELKSVKSESGIDVARFTVKAELAASPDALATGEVKTELTGEIAVAIPNSIALRASLSGPVTFEAKVGEGDTAVTIHGVGKTSWTFAAELR